MNTRRLLLIPAAATALICAGGCASAPKVIDRTVPGPQVAANPDSFSLGVANVMSMKIAFEGVGFQPDDTVSISLVGSDNTEIPLKIAKVDADGTFNTVLNDSLDDVLIKSVSILRADVSTATGKAQVVVSQPPVPAGSYRLKVISLEGEATAESTMNLQEPGMGDRTMDWIGGLAGIIVNKT